MLTNFQSAFGKQPMQKNFTPGRVNLIGEHLDYNGGMVLPSTLSIGIETAFSPRRDNEIHIASDRFEEPFRFRSGDNVKGHWAEYAVGAALYARRESLISAGADIFVASNMPDGAGLSSSAALIVSILKNARAQNSSSITDKEIAILARRVENEFVGVPCGIMDQMAVAIAPTGKALALDTKTLTSNVIPLPTTHHVKVIHSGVHRKLSEGRYSVRKEECDQARHEIGRDDICLASDEELARIESLPDPIRKRARHCVLEHRRTVNAAKSLAENNMIAFGEAMISSHASMRDDFEISLPAIDRLVEDAILLGAAGARLTGGGFGGCIVALVEDNIIYDWSRQLIERHPAAQEIC